MGGRGRGMEEQIEMTTVPFIPTLLTQTEA